MKDKAYYYLVEKLGFTPVEANVYLCLLKEHPQTGYKISTAIGKSRSSAYQAIKSLENRNVIIRLEGTQYGEYIPVSIEDYMNHKEKEFKKQKDEIVEAFKEVSQDRQQDVIYRITKTTQLFQKIESMISGAEQIILVDTDLAPLEKIDTMLEQKAQEGVKVLVETPEMLIGKSYKTIQLKSLTNKDIDWYAHWMCVSVDGQEFLISLLDPETGELIQGIWCRNPYISPWVFNGMLHEFSFRRLMDIIEKEATKADIQQKVSEYTNEFFLPVNGFIRLQEMLKSNFIEDINEENEIPNGKGE